jgi:hypothetical protein
MNLQYLACKFLKLSYDHSEVGPLAHGANLPLNLIGYSHMFYLIKFGDFNEIYCRRICRLAMFRSMAT